MAVMSPLTIEGPALCASNRESVLWDTRVMEGDNTDCKAMDEVGFR